MPQALSAVPAHKHEGINGRFVCVARLVDWNAIELAIKAIGRTPADITLNVFGAGDSEVTLKQLAKRLSVYDRVIFLGWAQHEKLMSKLENYRGFVLPSLKEANGIVFQEAIMAGVPSYL